VISGIILVSGYEGLMAARARFFSR